MDSVIRRIGLWQSSCCKRLTWDAWCGLTAWRLPKSPWSVLGIASQALGPKWGKNGPKMVKEWDLGSFFYFLPFWGHFPPFQGQGPFSIFRPISSIFGIWPVFHSMPGARNLGICEEAEFKRQLMGRKKSTNTDFRARRPSGGARFFHAKGGGRMVRSLRCKPGTQSCFSGISR